LWIRPKELEGFQMKLYKSNNYPNRWYAYSLENGWVMFPAVADGWAKRQPARGIDPIHLREVPVELGFSAGIPGSPNPVSDFAVAA
jgi:hypothetical protein